MSNGWWEQTGFAPVEGQKFNMDWADQALSLQALKSGGQIFHTNVAGTLKHGYTTESLCQSLEGLGGRRFNSQILPNGNTQHVLFLYPDGMASFYTDDCGYVQLASVSSDKRLAQAVRVLGNASLGARKSVGRIYVMVSNQSGYSLQSVGRVSVPVKPENYNQDVIDGFDHVVEDLKGNTPCGRIAIFSGAPGTGKTYLIRALLSSVPDAMFILVPPAIVPQLSGPNMVQTILNSRTTEMRGPTVLVIEDADECLIKRSSGSMSSVSALLNLSDGILGVELNLFVVASTNLMNTELDEAIERPGRLCQYVNVDRLSRDRAKVTLAMLAPELDLPSGATFSLAELYQLARPAKTVRPSSKPKKAAMGFAVQEGSDRPPTREAIQRLVDALEAGDYGAGSSAGSSSPPQTPEPV